MTGYILPSEVALHNTSQDCWVSFLDHVWDLTDLVKDRPNDPLVLPIIKAAGTDISHWFNPQTKNIRTRIDDISELEVPNLPMEHLLDVPDISPSTGLVPSSNPWWRQENRIVGKLSKKPRFIRIVNTLTGLEDVIEVAGEESIEDIRTRFKKINSHADSYTWKFLGRVLVMEKTLDQNGIYDESAKFARLNLDFDMYIPAILIYFNDELTVS